VEVRLQVRVGRVLPSRGIGPVAGIAIRKRKSPVGFASVIAIVLGSGVLTPAIEAALPLP
jgi:hypothetical protein